MATSLTAPVHLLKRAGVMHAVRALVPGMPRAAGPGPRHYPPQINALLEEAAVAREMRRL